MKKAALAGFVLACLLTAPVLSRADVISVNVFVPPFPADLAYPSFSDYTQVDFTAPDVLDFLRVGEDQATGALSTTAAYYGSGGLITDYAVTGMTLATGNDHHYIQSSGNGFTANAVHVFSDSFGPTSGGFGFNVAAPGGMMQMDVFTTVLGGATANVVLHDSSGATVTQALSSGPAVVRIRFNDGFSFALEGSNLSAANQVGLTGADIVATPAAVPEPASLVLVATGTLLLGAWRKRRS